MASKINLKRGKSRIRIDTLFLLFFAIGGLLLSVLEVQGQAPKPSPAPSSSDSLTYGGYEVTSSVEVGIRGVSVNGSDNKYRSDFNYRPGFRVFDSSLLMKRQEGKGGLFDTLLINSSGWNADPSGFTRINMEKYGFYRFDANIRQVVYFNDIATHARRGHTADKTRNFGDFDFTIFPQNENFRIHLGGGYNRNKGIGSITARAFSDEYAIPSQIDSRTTEFRAGVDGKLLGFNLSLGYGYRRFLDNTEYIISNLNPGFNTTNTAILNGFDRLYPIKGTTQYTSFNAQRTFARKLDLTARVIYSSSLTRANMQETASGRDTSNNIMDADIFNIPAETKRPQTRSDLGLTYRVTDKFRISNTFTFERFNIDGSSIVNESTFSHTATGAIRFISGTNNQLSYPVFPSATYYRTTGYERFLNTLEGDYQINDRFSLHLGYRYTHRKIDLTGYNFTVRSASNQGTAANPTFVSVINNPSFLCPVVVTSPNPATICEEEENTTQTFIGGFKAKPMKHWTVFGDLEFGEADNAFTRLANYNVTNFRLRSRWTFNRFAVNVSAISKNNENPSTSTAPQGPGITGDFIANTKSRIFSAYVDWSPLSRVSLSSGYTYQHLTSETDIVINTGTLVRGFSSFYMRDHNLFFDLTAQPLSRVSFFASYRYNTDRGQGERVPTGTNLLVTSYPFTLFNAEAKIAVRLTKHIDWNVGYQYLGYNDRFRVDPLFWVYTPQDYHANLPYTSLRIYLGRGER
jgi:hypothetical protein